MRHLLDLRENQPVHGGLMIESGFEIGKGGYVAISRFLSLVTQRLPRLLIARFSVIATHHLLLEPSSLPAEVRNTPPYLRNSRQWPNFSLPLGFESLEKIDLATGSLFLSVKPQTKREAWLLVDDPESQYEKYLVFSDQIRMATWLGGSILLLGVPLGEADRVMHHVLTRLDLKGT